MTETTTGETLDTACKRVTQEAVAESLAFIARAFDDTFAALAASEPKAGGEQIERQELTPAQLGAIIDALNFCLADDWDESSHEHGPEVYERALAKVQALNGRVLKALATPPQQPTAEPGEGEPVVASLIRDAIEAGTDAAADHASARINAYYRNAEPRGCPIPGACSWASTAALSQQPAKPSPTHT